MPRLKRLVPSLPGRISPMRSTVTEAVKPWARAPGGSSAVASVTMATMNERPARMPTKRPTVAASRAPAASALTMPSPACAPVTAITLPSGACSPASSTKPGLRSWGIDLVAVLGDLCPPE